MPFPVFSRRFRRKCTTQWLVFFRQFNTIGPLFCSFAQHHQLELRKSKTYSKRFFRDIDALNTETLRKKFEKLIIIKDVESFWSFYIGMYFFHILQPTGVSQSPKGPPFTILSLRYSADFGRSRLVSVYNPFKTVRLLKTIKIEAQWQRLTFGLESLNRSRNTAMCEKINIVVAKF